MRKSNLGGLLQRSYDPAGGSKHSVKDFRYSVFSAYYSQQWFENCLANYRRQSTVGTWRPPFCPISRTALKASVAVEAEKRANANDLTTLYPNGYCIAIEACLKPSALDEVTSGKFRSYSLLNCHQKNVSCSQVLLFPLSSPLY